MNQLKNKISFPLQTRFATLETQADIKPSDDSAIFNVVFSTGATVRRCDVFNDCYYDEQLVIDPSSIRLERLNSGAPVLDTHADVSLANVIGVVVPGSVVIDAGTARASIKVDTGPENQSTVRKIKDGIIRNISVGYVVHKFEVINNDDNSVPLYRATDWEPYEISLVPIGADSGAGIRAGPTVYPCEITNTINPITNPKETYMNDTTQHDRDTTDTDLTSNFNSEAVADSNASEDVTGMTSSLPPVTSSSGDTTQTRSVLQANLHTDPDSHNAIKQERNRVLEIQKIVRAAKLSTSIETQLISSGTGIAQARKIVLDKLAAQSTDSEQIRSVRITHDEMDSRRALESALLNRYSSQFKLIDGAREFRGMSLMEIGRDLLQRRGVNITGLSRNQIAGVLLGMETRGGYMGTSDFPAILSNVANKTLRAAYEDSPQTFKAFTRQNIVPDFKMVSRLQLGDAPNLELVGESGEFKRGSLSESKEQYKIAPFGKVVAINRQTIINDDLSAFTRLPALFGKAAADLESDTVWGIITSNMQMGDGVELFHAKHANVSATGGTINIQTLGSARQALRQQKSLNGRFINVTAKYLIVPSSLETVAQQMMTSTNIVFTKSPDVNPFAGTLQIIAEPRLDAHSASAWYLAGDPSQIDTIEYAYLEGCEGVQLEHRIGFDVDGVELKARLDFGAKAIDYRGFYRNSGQSS